MTILHFIICMGMTVYSVQALFVSTSQEVWRADGVSLTALVRMCDARAQCRWCYMPLIPPGVLFGYLQMFIGTVGAFVNAASFSFTRGLLTSQAVHTQAANLLCITACTAMYIGLFTAYALAQA